MNDKSLKDRIVKDFKRNKVKYYILIPVLIYLILFCYKPMYGIIIAFKNYRPTLGVMASKWVGLQWFESFFGDIYFPRLLRNTFTISMLKLLFTFPSAILLALMLNEVKVAWFGKIVQTVTYLPHFIAMVVMCGLITSFTQTNGLVTNILVAFGMERVNLLSKPEFFYPIYIISEIWKNVGWDSIIFLAALSGIDQEQYEAAKIDGAGRLKQIWYITLPGILPTIVMLLILKMGQVLGVGHEKILLLYQPLTYEVADVISTYSYRKAFVDANYSYSTAIGLFNSVVNIIFLRTANFISKKAGQSGLF